MAIPSPAVDAGGPPWASLSADEKRSRTLSVASELFAREGVELPMPALADALGVGVGSIYRQLGKKDDLIAALVIERLERAAERFTVAARMPDALAALHAATLATVDDCISDGVMQAVWEETLTRADVQAARERVSAALEALVEHARAAGALRADATIEDLRLIFRAVKDAETLGDGGARRLGELVLRGLSA